jgi:Putative peptidoglycan binding domain
VTAKRLTAARFAGVPELEEAFSDTTDTKDIWDGGGNLPRSEGHHVALLQESLLAMGYGLPHGADGLYGDETTAAVTQFQIDAGHPWPAGQEWEHIGGIAGPNTMAHFDMFDPGGTVGNVTRSISGLPAAALRFCESPDNLFAGFDKASSTPFLFVGTRTRRRVGIELEPANADVLFTVDDPSIATVGLIDGGIVVGGEGRGTTSVLASSGGRQIGELRVRVNDVREAVVNFFFVSDVSDPPFASERDHEKATLLTLRLNRIFRRQANVHFTLGEVRDVVAPAAIGPNVTAAECSFLGPYAINGQLNVFCVWSVATHDLQSPDPSLLVLADRDCADGMTVPHGAGHFLGARDSSSGLMAGCDQGADRRRINRQLAQVVNP